MNYDLLNKAFVDLRKVSNIKAILKDSPTI